MTNPADQDPNADKASTAEEAPHGKAVFDEDGSKWKETQDSIINYPHIISLRGAGAKNGINKEAANKLVDEQLIPRIKAYMSEGPVALMFDGDGDNLQKPDIGFIMGRLRDAFGSEADGKIRFITAQVEGWMPQKREGEPDHRNITNANKREYETTVFRGGQFPGDHNSFTQSRELANAPGFEVWFVGPTGSIGNEQLGDLDGKISEGTRKVVMFRAPLNEDLQGGFEQQLTDAKAAGDAKKVANLEATLAQRAKSKYGENFDDDGKFNVDRKRYGNVDFEVV